MKNSHFLILITASFAMLICSCKKNKGADTNNIETQLKNGLIAGYSFTGNAMDNSGNNNNGTVIGATLTADRFGNPNSAYNFNASNFITTPVVQYGITVCSISLWFKTSIGGWIFKGGRDCRGGTGISMAIAEPNQYKVVFGADDDRYIEGSFTTNAYNDNKWHHFVGVWDGTGKVLIDPDQFSIYIDGAFVTQYKYSTVTAPNGFGEHHTIPLLGTDACGFAEAPCNYTTAQYVGQLDDIRIYNRVLTTNEITYLATH